MRDRFEFAFDRAARVVLAPLGVWPSTAWVDVSDDELTVRFGPLGLTTSRANITEACVGGPYQWYRAIGPRMSLTDRGVTFGTNARAGVCVLFAEPVPALFGGLIRHPGATLTVAYPEQLRDLLAPQAAESRLRP